MIVLNDGMINEGIWKELDYTGICIEGLRKTTKQDT
jgi:hypothetical protein